MVKEKILAIVLGLIFTVLFVGIASAQQAQPTPSDDQVNAIARQLYCPVCENIPLDVCSTPACAQWRELIRQKLAIGWNEQQIKQYFVQQYGERVLGTPPARGINWLIYLVPPLAIIIGLYIIYRAYRSWKHPVQDTPVPPGSAGPPPGLDGIENEYIRRMEEEVHKR